VNGSRSSLSEALRVLGLAGFVTTVILAEASISTNYRGSELSCGTLFAIDLRLLCEPAINRRIWVLVIILAISLVLLYGWHQTKDGLHEKPTSAGDRSLGFRERAAVSFAAEMARKTKIKSDSEPQSPRPAEGRSSSTTSSQSRRSAAGERRPTTSAREPGLSVAEELERFANLRDRGVLSDEEFEAQKSKLLDG